MLVMPTKYPRVVYVSAYVVAWYAEMAIVGAKAPLNICMDVRLSIPVFSQIRLILARRLSFGGAV